MLSRRGFLILGAITLASIGSYPYLNNEEMKNPPEIEGRILVDLHAHPSRQNSQRDLTSLLSSGVTGLTARNNSRRIFTYDDALQLPGVKEIDKGLFGSLSLGGRTGYFVRTQEVDSDFHILAVGCPKTIENYPDARRAIEEIRRQSGLAVLNHPYVNVELGYFRYPRLIRTEQEKRIRELCELVDEVEVFNASAINAIPFIADLSPANESARKLVNKLTQQGMPHVGIAVSDAHYRLEQVKIAGIYVPQEGLSIEALKDHIHKKRFDRFEQHISRLSILRGFFEGILYSLKY